ncbi:uncharacterized protein F5Z01DRAFT_309714 [Emericellopsis atlantica]|uniref:Uncharacterized protein n=1 Tax=Emericellopsis atlantica TaxID=2614577 RepID=A0A9P7ZT79_9HYPO|nr:uncharacterized protein F5Z01DRAFT_309714 [Emericellopsis atlantica]KAG9257918.1 hypothetical protein F5Z01DRAFT_309714 [Emericellopsis atlantica]
MVTCSKPRLMHPSFRELTNRTSISETALRPPFSRDLLAMQALRGMGKPILHFVGRGRAGHVGFSIWQARYQPTHGRLCLSSGADRKNARSCPCLVLQIAGVWCGYWALRTFVVRHTGWRSADTFGGEATDARHVSRPTHAIREQPRHNEPDCLIRSSDEVSFIIPSLPKTLACSIHQTQTPVESNEGIVERTPREVIATAKPSPRR